MRMTCRLDGVSPESLDERIVVTDITEQAPEVTRTAVRHARGGGTLVTEEERLSLSVTVKLLVKERHPLRRALLLERLALWCRGSELRLDSRPGRRLTVRCEKPLSGGLRGWAEELSVTFTARAVPYWEEERERSLTLTDAAEWYIPGTAPETAVSFGAENTGEDTATGLTLKVGDTGLALDGLLLAPGERVNGTVSEGLLTLTLQRTDGTRESAAAYLTEDSDDLLMIPCGARTAVSLESDQPMTAVLWARGRYL